MRSFVASHLSETIRKPMGIRQIAFFGILLDSILEEDGQSRWKPKDVGCPK